MFIFRKYRSKRDWGHARDFVEMQWLMLQQSKPKDYVISTGNNISVKDFIEIVAKNLDLEIFWRGDGLNQKGYIFRDNKEKVIIKIDPKYFRPTEVDVLLGDASKARKDLGWKPKTSINQLVKEMVEEDLKLAKEEVLLNQRGN